VPLLFFLPVEFFLFLFVSVVFFLWPPRELKTTNEMPKAALKEGDTVRIIDFAHRNRPKTDLIGTVGTIVFAGQGNNGGWFTVKTDKGQLMNFRRGALEKVERRAKAKKIVVDREEEVKQRATPQRENQPCLPNESVAATLASLMQPQLTNAPLGFSGPTVFASALGSAPLSQMSANQLGLGSSVMSMQGAPYHYAFPNFAVPPFRMMLPSAPMVGPSPVRNSAPMINFPSQFQLMSNSEQTSVSPPSSYHPIRLVPFGVHREVPDPLGQSILSLPLLGASTSSSTTPSSRMDEASKDSRH